MADRELAGVTVAREHVVVLPVDGIAALEATGGGAFPYTFAL